MEISINSIFHANYLPARPWNTRPDNGYKTNLINEIRKILNLLSGDQMTEMLKDVIKNDELKLVADKYYKGLSLLSVPINIVKKKNQHYFIRPLKLAKISKIELNEMGFQFGNHLWSTCLSEHERLQGGNSCINKSTIDAINLTLQQNSSFSSYNTVKVRKRKATTCISELEPRKKKIKENKKRETEILESTVMNRTVTLQEAKSKFDNLLESRPDLNIQKICLKTFQNYVKKEKVYKKPKSVINQFYFIVKLNYNYLKLSTREPTSVHIVNMGLSLKMKLVYLKNVERVFKHYWIKKKT